MGRAVVALVLLAPALAAADGWTVTGEAGAELDTNVQRVETGPDLTTAPVTSPVVRFGVRADGRGKLLDGGYVVSLSDLTRVVGDSSASVENVTLLAGDMRWMHALGDQPVSVGVGVTGADALPTTDPVGARTFKNLGADALIAARTGDDKRLLLAIGGRSFTYKPDHTYDWTGPTASARLDLTPWQSDGGARTLELAFTAGLELRAYDSAALVDACPPGAPPDPSCSSSVSLSRRDRFARTGVELTWTGKQVIAVGYQLAVIDSNSYGQSLTRHRATASVTSALPGGTFGTLLAILQIDRYQDGLVVGDITLRDFANIEDENVSSIQARLAKKLSSAWSLEARAAVWRNIGSSSMNLEFHRELVYGGLMYSH